MAQIMETTRITATWAAHRAIAQLRSSLGERLTFVQSGGCCAGGTLACLPASEFLVGDNDLQLGVIDGCPFYIDARLDQAWGRVQLTLDVKAGEPEGLSLSAGSGKRFMTTSSACPTHARNPS